MEYIVIFYFSILIVFPFLIFHARIYSYLSVVPSLLTMLVFDDILFQDTAEGRCGKEFHQRACNTISSTSSKT